jgi:hypothetical protein
LWIRVGCIADPDLAFYLSVDPGSQTNADPWIRIRILVIL